MARPSPVPPYFRVVEASTWENDWNSRPTRSAGMPMPVSLTVNFTMATLPSSPTSDARTTTSVPSP